jgi:prepilin-type N-terminal cleavage/methylation domain-containing protein
MEPGTMPQAKRQHSEKGFTLIETMIALMVLAIGVLGLAAMLADSLSYMQGSQADFIAQQKAQEAAEAIFTAKYNNPNNWAQISNNTGANPNGLFMTGPQPLLQPGPDGLVGSINDTGASPEYTLLPGPDGKLGTADDLKIPLTDYTRTIVITNDPTDTNLRDIQITINYTVGRFKRSHTLQTDISAFN